MHGALPAMTAMPPPATWREIRGGGHVLVPGRASRHNLLRGFPADFRGRWPYDRTHKKEQKSTCSALHVVLPIRYRAIPVTVAANKSAYDVRS